MCKQTRTPDQQQRDRLIRSINTLVRNADGVNAELIPEGLRQQLLELKAKHPSGVSLRMSKEHGYLFVGGSLSELNTSKKDGD